MDECDEGMAVSLVRLGGEGRRNVLLYGKRERETQTIPITLRVLAERFTPTRPIYSFSVRRVNSLISNHMQQ